LGLVTRRRIAHGYADQEAVNLRFRKRIRSFEVDGVLRCEDHEWQRELEPIALDRHLPLLHRLEQRALCFSPARD